MDHRCAFSEFSRIWQFPAPVDRIHGHVDAIRWIFLRDCVSDVHGVVVDGASDDMERLCVGFAYEDPPCFSWEIVAHPGQNVEKALECNFVDIEVESTASGEDFVPVHVSMEVSPTKFTVVGGYELILRHGDKHLGSALIEISSINIITVFP